MHFVGQLGGVALRRRKVRIAGARLEVLPFEERAAAHYGEIRADLERAGTPIGPYDLMIAGHARSQGLTLVTNNTREFERVGGLRTENWAGREARRP